MLHEKMVAPSGLKIAIDSLVIWNAVQKARDEGLKPYKVLVPCLVDSSPIGKSKRGRRGLPDSLWGVTVGIGPKLIVVSDDGCLTVWEN